LEKKLEHKHFTAAEALKAAGYTTALVGKWHLAPRPPHAEEGNPGRHGFDIQHVKPRQARGYYLPKGFNQDGKSGSDYATDYLTDKALEVIDDHTTKPFFLYFAYHTPHTPIQGHDSLVRYFNDKVQPDSIHNNPVYAAMVKSLDQSVGRILEKLEQHGLDDNTMIIFTSDNGGLTQRYGKHDGFTENLPLRRGKGSAYEGGVRVPTIIHWPGVTRPGTQCETPIMSIDYFPTLLEFATITNTITINNFDGQSILPLLKNPETQWQRDLFWHYPHYHAGGDGPYSAMRSGPWRLIEFHEDKHIELYNLSEDIGETNNLAQTHSKKTNELKEKLHQWRSRVKAQMPAPNPNFDPSRATQVAGK
jgi:arylsulfatase A